MSESNKLLPQSRKVAERLPILNSTIWPRRNTKSNQNSFQTTFYRNSK